MWDFVRAVETAAEHGMLLVLPLCLSVDERLIDLPSPESPMSGCVGYERRPKQCQICTIKTSSTCKSITSRLFCRQAKRKLYHNFCND